MTNYELGKAPSLLANPAPVSDPTMLNRLQLIRRITELERELAERPVLTEVQKIAIKAPWEALVGVKVVYESERHSTVELIAERLAMSKIGLCLNQMLRLKE